MPHYFEKVPSWRTVPVSDVPVSPFLDAAQGLVGIFDHLGSMAFIPVKNDITKNIAALRTAHTLSPLCRTVRQLLLAERTAGRTRGECAITSYIWLVRSLEFIGAAFYRWQTTQDELKTCFGEAYKTTLYNHHTWIQYSAFHMALASVPTRAYLLARLGNPPPTTVDDYFTALREVTAALPSVS